jgi:hypothetical protein
MTSRSCFIENEKLFRGKPEEIFFNQYMGTVFSYLGEDKESRLIFDRLNTAPSSQETINLSQFEIRNAAKEIVSVVKGRQILAINEAHHVPQTRLLTLQLLKPLYKKGFRYLAAETFDETTLDETIRLGFPTQRTGYYTAEPVYALIVREALRLGYKLIPYESSPKCDPFNDPPEKCQNLREERQAKNLYERIFKNDPKAKVIIHAGYGHIDKKGGDENWKWIPMARYLWELTKIEPFSVDQTFFFEKGRPELNSKLYQQIFDHKKYDQPVLLMNRKSKKPFIASNYKDHYDAQVFLPPLDMKNGRSSWRENLPRIRPTQLSNFDCPSQSRCLLQAIVKAELNTPFVPMDQTLLEGSQVTLYLQPGEYSLRLVDKEDQVLEERDFKAP